jgi:hypothetical protein
MAIKDTTRTNEDGSEANNHLTVCKKFCGPLERLRGPVSNPGSRLSPPAPLTGDVGRGCGDASRALLFFQNQISRMTWISAFLRQLRLSDPARQIAK